jgi:HEAT repeat protein
MHRRPCLLLAGYRLDREAAVVAAEAHLRRRPGLPGLLPRLGPAAVRALLDALDREPHRAGDPSLEGTAALVLREVGEAALPVLLGLLTSEQWDEWQSALRALGDMGPAARGAVPALLALLEDRERRREVVRALGRMGAAETVPHLVGLLEDDRVRPAAMEALGRIGPAAREAIPALRQFVNRWGERELQYQAMEALRAITRREGGGGG